MFLSQLTLNPRCADARRDLGSAYDMHRTLSRAFTPDSSTPPNRFLWRLDSNPIGWNPPAVLVQSLTAGDWSVLQNLSGYLVSDVEHKFLDLSALLQRDASMRFRFLANPTVKRDGKRLGLVGEDTQLSWLTRQGEKHGFRVEFALVSGQDLLGSKKDCHRLTIQRVLFEGRLRVTDTSKLAEALALGIGPAKSFGCGMLSVAPA
jgi:CRISPR system Cascade subunit CasE